MIRAEAVKIVKDIHTDDADPEDKLMALQEIVEMETHNSVTKQTLVEALRWILEDYL